MKGVSMDKLEKIKKPKRWKYKRYLFHVTDGMKVEKILSEGLIRGGGERKAIAVYMSKNPLSWWEAGKAILRIDTMDLIGEWSDFLSECDEILYWGDIEKERITLYEPTIIEHIKMINSMQIPTK